MKSESTLKKTFVYKRTLDLLRVTLVVLIFLTIANFWYVNRQRDNDEHYLIHSNTLRVLSQRISKNAEEALRGNETALVALTLYSNEFTDNLNILKYGVIVRDIGQFLPPTPKEIQENELKKIITLWNKLKVKVDFITQNDDAVLQAKKMTSQCLVNLKNISEGLRDVALNLAKINPADLYGKIKETAYLLQETTKLRMVLIDTLDVNSVNPLDIDLISEINKFHTALQALAQKNQESTFSALFADLNKNIQAIESNVDAILKVGRILDELYMAKTNIYTNSISLLDLASSLETAYRVYASHRMISQFSAYILSLLMFGCMATWFYFLYKENQQNLKETEEESKKLQDEIQKLLTELTGLAKGDLTVWVETKEGLTKEIAQAINYSVSALRHVITNINQTAKDTSIVASDAETVAKELALSSESQALEISETTNSVRTMVASIEKVSTNASQSEAVAQESVKMANEGGKIVRNTINGMERIQIQIQETSDKIKRLSKSSQEIGEIINLIDEISEQTNILSLNASIQAATAGEAGRGFAVVADEVQQLAEKAGSATKEISTLVKSIQTDTQQVITAMEHTRTEVLQGVSLAQNAGNALEKIEEVSHQLSDLVHDISMSAHEQASMSNKISAMMSAIKEIANKTAGGTIHTAKYIAKLTQLISDLRHSVSEFKLPKKNDGTQ